MFDVKKFIKLNRLTIVICSLLLLIIVVPITYSRFQSNVDPKINIGTAFYVLGTEYQTKTIKLENLVPSNMEHVYEFTVANNNGNARCEVDMEYEVVVTSTTNLPLTLSLSYVDDDTNIIRSNEIIQDDDGMYLKEIKTNKEVFEHNKLEEKRYKLTVVFPNEYTDTLYQDIIEGIMISVNSVQIIDD